MFYIIFARQCNAMGGSRPALSRLPGAVSSEPRDDHFFVLSGIMRGATAAIVQLKKDKSSKKISHFS